MLRELDHLWLSPATNLWLRAYAKDDAATNDDAETQLAFSLAWLSFQIPGNKKDSRFRDPATPNWTDKRLRGHVVFFWNMTISNIMFYFQWIFVWIYVFCLEWRVWSCQNDMSPDAEGLWTSLQLLTLHVLCLFFVWCVKYLQSWAEQKMLKDLLMGVQPHPMPPRQ